MSIKHHLHEPTLLAYATGNLPEAVNLIVAAHVSLCRAIVESFDAVGGALLEETEAAQLEQDSLERAMARIETGGAIKRAPATPGTLPEPVQAYVGGDLEAVKWRPVGMGAA